MLQLAALYLLGVNLIAFLTYRADKRRAEAGARRVPERTLLALAALGGWVGAETARRVFRHKTRKEPFASAFRLIGAAWAIGLGLLLMVRR